MSTRLPPFDDTPTGFARRLADYMAQRNTPWPDEAAMRDAVEEVVRLIFTEALTETRRLAAREAE